mmetsp:Transcript_57664/g.172051  ORF Transcript_57664/g.172051 Transcript_57664/m.172051 type:complete len:85 (-) Transcript_57664:867-1121(-)
MKKPSIFAHGKAGETEKQVLCGFHKQKMAELPLRRDLVRKLAQFVATTRKGKWQRNDSLRNDIDIGNNSDEQQLPAIQEEERWS